MGKKTTKKQRQTRRQSKTYVWLDSVGRPTVGLLLLSSVGKSLSSAWSVSTNIVKIDKNRYPMNNKIIKRGHFSSLNFAY